MTEGTNRGELQTDNDKRFLFFFTGEGPIFK